MPAVYYLAWLLAIVLVAVGIYALAAPRTLAQRYGIAIGSYDAAGFVRATGIRDVAIGVVLAATAYVHAIALLVVVAVMGIVVSIADFTIVSRHGASHRLHGAHAVHASGILAFILVIAMALFAIGR